jgi:hypothetical protein
MARTKILTPRIRANVYILASQNKELDLIKELTGKNRTQLFQDAIAQYIYNLKQQGVL